MKSVFDKDTSTIVVTDSGLGGFSVAADLLERLKAGRIFRHAKVVFFNTLPSNHTGFDDMESYERRYRVFSNALHCMAERFSADAILIACNTLTVIYHKTPFAENPPVPVLGVVKAGVDMAADYLDSTPNSQVVLLGTKVTIHMDIHRQELLERGYSDDRIIPQGWNKLAMAIEHGPREANTLAILDECVGNVVRRMPDTSRPTAAVLACTHYGYAPDIFREAFAKYGITLDAVLDPNRRMCDDFMAPATLHRFDQCDVAMEAVCQSNVSDIQKQCVSRLVSETSQQAARVLLHESQFIPNMFSID